MTPRPSARRSGRRGSTTTASTRDELAAYLSLEDADRLLTATAIRTPSVRLVRDGAVLPESGYTRGATLAGRQLTGLVDGRKARRGVPQRRDRRLPGAAPLLPAADRPDRRARARARPPLPGQRLPDPARLAGLRGALRHPRRVRAADRRHQAVGAAPAPEPDRATRSRCSSRGTSMYLPTGTPHAARAQDTVSLHITIGINQLTWRGLVQRALELAGRRGARRPPARRLPRRPAGARPPAGPAPLRHRRPAARRRPRGRGRGGGTPLPHLAAAAAARARSSTGSPSTRSTTTPCCAAGPGHPCVLVEQGRPARGAARRPHPRRTGLAPARARGGPRAAPSCAPRDLPLDEQSRLVLCPTAGPGRAAQGRP